MKHGAQLLLFLTIFLFASTHLCRAQSSDPILDRIERGEVVSLSTLPVVKNTAMSENVRSFIGSLAIAKPKITDQAGVKIIQDSIVVNNLPVAISLRGENGIWSVLIDLPAGFRYASIDNQLSALDRFSINRAAIIVSQREIYIGQHWNITAEPGVSLVMALGVMGDIERLVSIVPGARKSELVVQGTLTPTIAGSSCKVELPGHLTFGSLGETTALSLVLYFKPLASGIAAGPFDIAVAIKTGFRIRLPKQEKTITFLGEIQVNAVKLMVSGWMVGFWENAFGIPGFGIGDLGMSIVQNYAIAAASLGTIPVTELCLQGGLPVGMRTVKLTGCMDVDPDESDVILTGSFEGGLYLQDIVDLGADIITRASSVAGKKAQLIKKIEGIMPRVGFKTADLYVITNPTTIMGKKYKQGIDINGSADLFGKDVGIAFSVDSSKVSGQGYIKECTIGPLSISGSEAKQKSNAPANAAEISIMIDPLSKKLAEFYIDGNVVVDLKELGMINAIARVNVGLAGLYIETSAQLFNDCEANFKIRGYGPVSPIAQGKAIADANKIIIDSTAKAREKRNAQRLLDAAGTGGLTNASNWRVHIRLQQNALQKLSAEIKNTAQNMVDDAQQAMNMHKETVRKLDATIALYDQQIADLQQRIAAQETENEKNVDDAMTTLSKAQSQLSLLDGLKKDLDAQIALCKEKNKASAEEVEDLMQQAPTLQQEKDKAAAHYINALNVSPDVAARIQDALKAKKQTALSIKSPQGQGV